MLKPADADVSILLTALYHAATPPAPVHGMKVTKSGRVSCVAEAEGLAQKKARAMEEQTLLRQLCLLVDTKKDAFNAILRGENSGLRTMALRVMGEKVTANKAELDRRDAAEWERLQADGSSPLPEPAILQQPATFLAEHFAVADGASKSADSRSDDEWEVLDTAASLTSSPH